MKGDAKVIDYLNKGLRSELTAINQYWLHYRLLENWGYNVLAKKWREQLLQPRVLDEPRERDIPAQQVVHQISIQHAARGSGRHVRVEHLLQQAAELCTVRVRQRVRDDGITKRSQCVAVVCQVALSNRGSAGGQDSPLH